MTTAINLAAITAPALKKYKLTPRMVEALVSGEVDGDVSARIGTRVALIDRKLITPKTRETGHRHLLTDEGRAVLVELRATAQPEEAPAVDKDPTVTTATDILNLADTITGRDLHALGAAWNAGQPASWFTDRAWELNTTVAFELWDGIGHRVLSRIHWSPAVSDGLLAMRYAALALVARDQLTPFEFGSLASPWESVMGRLPAAA